MQVGGSPSVAQTCTRSVADRIKGISLNDGLSAAPPPPAPQNHVTDGLLDCLEPEGRADGAAPTDLNGLGASRLLLANGNGLDRVEQLKAGRQKNSTASNLVNSAKNAARATLQLNDFQRNAVRVIGQYLSELGLR